MGRLSKKYSWLNEWLERKRHRRYGTIVLFSASRKVRCYKRNNPHFELSGCCLKACRFPTLTCDKCHLEY